jgi:RNA polymerase sigma-70 factor (ECF subfamily)
MLKERPRNLMSDQELTDIYVETFTAAQAQLYNYIYSLTRRVDQTKDILQETNRKLWQLREEFDHSREFLPWACTVAYNQVRAARTKTKRERLVFQDDEVVHALANEQVSWNSRSDDRETALEKCIGTLSEKHKKIVSQYYKDGYTMEEVGNAFKKSAGSIAVTLHRVRLSLAECIRGQLV